jgi:hypothetical protein
MGRTSGGTAAAAGALTLISSQVLAATAASITFSGIPTTYNHLQLECLAAGSASASSYFTVQFNGDTGLNYNFGGWFNGFGVVAGNGGGKNQSSINVHGTDSLTDLPGTSITDYAAYYLMKLPCYANTTFYKAGTFECGFPYDWDNTGVQIVAGWAWASTAAINEIVLAPGANSFAVGSAFYLYGIT